MNNDAYDDPRMEAGWLADQRLHVASYLAQEELAFRSIPKKPVWFVAPYVSLWRIRSRGRQFLWVITGDVPADYLVCTEAPSARQAVHVFSDRWHGMAQSMIQGARHPKFSVGGEKDLRELGDLLSRRADILQKWSRDDSLW